MKKIMMVFYMVILVLGLVTGANAALVLDFEDLYTDTYQAIPNGYGGFNWNDETQIGVGNGPKYAPGSGYDYGSVSGDMVAFNYYGNSPSSIDLIGSGTFSFIGAYFTSAWYDQTIRFEGYNDGSLSYASDWYSINTTQPQWIELNWSGIDSLVIYNTHMQWAMDNFTYNPVPIPSAILLLGSGLIGIVGYGRRKFKK